MLLLNISLSAGLLRRVYAPLWLIIAPLIIFTWNDPQLFHNFSSVFWNYMFFTQKSFFFFMLYNLGEDYKAGCDFAL